MKYDLIVIGGGPAGYVAAIRAAQLGKSVLCAESGRLGGTCLNRGCIPTKALLSNAEVYRRVQGAAEFGISTGELHLDWGKVMERTAAVSTRLANGVAFLFRKNKVQHLCGTARITDPGCVEITAEDGSVSTAEGANILIATGARPRELPAFPFNGRSIISGTEALRLPELPESMLVIGSGAIGTELSYIYHSFGTHVTLVEALPRLLPAEDDEISAALERSFRAQGITCHTGATVQSLRETTGGAEAELLLADGSRSTISVSVALVAVGVVPVVPEAPGLELTERGFIKTDARYRTNLPGVYAVGDCTGGVLLAHKASYEAVQAVQGMFDAAYEPKHPTHIPGCTYCHPQVASVGARESELKAAGTPYRVGKFPFSGIGRAVAAGESEGFIKLLFGAENGELLGAHIIGPDATELITAPELAISSELCDADIEAMIYAHPTLAEALHEAVLAADGRAIHA